MLPVVERKATKKVEVSFRELYSFPSTTYGLFGLYKYPAKFIPHVPLYALKEYASEKDIVLDPFAGQGSVGFACWLTGNSYELWDINPILEFLHSFVYIGKVSEMRIMKALESLTQESFIYLPKWDNIDYWYPEEFKELLGKAWFSVKNIEEPDIRKILTLALLKVSKFLSYADEKVHKLYKSKRAIRKVKELLSKDYKSVFKERLRAEVINILGKLAEWRRLKLKNPENINVYIGDIFERELDREIDVLLTSPPYIQAQEYIRSTKLELYWLGFDDERIRELSSKEIPYRRKQINVEINSSLYWDIYQKISKDSVRQVFENYFKSLICILDRLSEKVKKYMLLFVGPVHVRDIQVPIDNIITEHFLNKGWKHKLTYVDTVKSRVMFNTKTYLNPSTGLKNKKDGDGNAYGFGKMLKERYTKSLIESSGTMNIIKELKRNVKILFEIYSEKEIFEILTSLARIGDPFVDMSKRGRKIELSWNMEHILEFMNNTLIPNTILLGYKDRDVIELLMFSMEFAFSMLEGKTSATKTQKGFRERGRDVETIMVNTFTGLIGEVGLRRLLKEKFNVEIDLDRTISIDISQYKSDILNSKKPVSIKTTPNLKAVWAECPVGYDVGIFVKASVPEAVFINALAQVCAFRKLVEFSKEVLGESPILKTIESRLYYDKCGAVGNVIKCFICGYMETEGLEPTEKGEKLPYLGEVREKRYLLEFTKLKSTEKDWKIFVERFLS